MDQRTRYEDLDEAIQTIVEAKLAHVQTSVPCEIVSVDFAKQTAVLQPTVKALVRNPDGTQRWISMPQIPDVPLHFPSGGGVTMTFPIKKGDEALAVISSRNSDAWQQAGGEQQQVDMRGHDLSNAFAFVGFKSNAKALSNVSSDATQIRSDDGQTVIGIKGGEVEVKSGSASSKVTTDSVTSSVGDVSVKVTRSRVDLGGENGARVMTEAGPSSKVYAVT